MKKVLITWWSKWLWLEISNLLLSKWIEVVSLSRTKADNSSEHIFTDFLKNESIDSAINEVLEKYPDFDALILCAWGWEIEEIWEIKEESLENTIKLNLNSNILIADKLLDKINENWADIVVIWATIWYKANKFMPVYSIAKWWLRWFVENIREACKWTNSRIINIVPWGLNTESNIWPEWRETIIAKKTGKEVWSLLDASELAKLVYYFLSLPKNMEVSEIIVNRK